MGSRDFTCNSPKRRLRHVVESRDSDRLVEHLHLEAAKCGITFEQAYDEEMAAVKALAKIAHLADEITPCQPPQSWYDE